MKLISKLAAASALALSMAAAGAANAAIFIGVYNTGTMAIDTIHTQADGPIAFAFSGGGFESITIDGNGAPALPGLLHTETTNLNNSGPGAASITFYVTRTGLTSPVNKFTSTFTSNRLNGPFAVTLSTLVDTTNGLFGGTQLSAVNYPTAFGSTMLDANFSTGAGPYSVTTKYVVSGTGRGSVTPDITIAGVVPEPGTWALMILGFGGAGAMLRSRRKVFAAA